VDCSADPSQPDTQPDPAPTIRRPDLKFNLLRLTAQAVRVTASTIAVVVLLRQQWVAAGAFALIWLLILGAQGSCLCQWTAKSNKM
jgi:type IV secretory pathway TrbD component